MRKSFCLASASPRRRDILKKYGYEFTVLPADIDESVPSDLDVNEIPLYLARKKARAVADKTGEITLGSDTIVVLDGKVLGKPESPAENEEYLKMLSGKTHFVYTGYCVIAGDDEYSGVDRAAVTFRKLSFSDIAEYVSSGNGLDKAGGYGVQDGYGLVKSVDGEFETVVGLPITKVNAILEKIL